MAAEREGAIDPLAGVIVAVESMEGPGHGIRRADDLAAVVAFFEARNGRLHSFRFKDWGDHKSCLPSGKPSPTDQAIDTGDGTTTAFQLVKRYASGSQTWTRTITKPVPGTVRVALDGVEVARSAVTFGG